MPINQSEAKTRKDIIDKRLKKAGWDVSDPTQVTSELDIWVGLPEGIKNIFMKNEVVTKCNRLKSNFLYPNQ